VLKPGAMLMAFGGPRTHHRLMAAVEDAGFEIRDVVMWLYGSGFPKSHDISKAIDKAAGSIGESTLAIKREIRQRYESAGMTLGQLNDACGFEASGYLRESSTWATVLPSRDKWQRIKAVLGCDGELDALFDEAEREVIGQSEWSHQKGIPLPNQYDGQRQYLDITAPATDAAALWDGWGTALKPAFEPVIVAMKPTDGTFAHNAQKWGVAGLWVDGGRIPTNGESVSLHGRNPVGNGWDPRWSGGQEPGQTPGQKLGRWPANVILDEEAAAMLDEQSGESTSSGPRPLPQGPNYKNEVYGDGMGGCENHTNRRADTGGASRFFYCAKASRAERNAGLEGMEERERVVGIPQSEGRVNHQKHANGEHVAIAAQNHHPTVKPLALMQYLCRLTKTPTGGIILDPFMGSGSTGIAAVREGRSFVGIELDADYCEIARRRIGADAPLLVEMG
jgi:hypothetical protein